MTKGYRGVRTQKRRRKGKEDTYFSIRYTRNGKQYEEGIGYKSEGWTAKEVSEILSSLDKEFLLGGAFSLKERNKRREQAKKANEETLKQEKIKEQLNEVTFSRLYEEYKKGTELNHKKSTFNREISLYEKWLKPFWGDVTANLISPVSLNSILKTMKNAGLANRTQNYAIALVRQIFNYAIDNNLYLGKNPAARFKFPKTDNKRQRYLTDEELEKLLTELKKHSYNVYLMALLAAKCGLRAGEIFNLTWEDVNLKQKNILIRDPKNGKNRYAFMTDIVFDEISNLKKGEGNQFLFQSRNGKKIEHISRTFERAVKAVGLNKGITDRRQKVVFHSLRHTYASNLVQKGVSLYIVQKLLGHTDIKMTMRYSHLSDETLKQAVSKLN